MKEYQSIIEIFTKPGELILDACAGSGTILLAAKATGRQYLGIVKNEQRYLTAKGRLSDSATCSAVGSTPESSTDDAEPINASVEVAEDSLTPLRQGRVEEEPQHTTAGAPSVAPGIESGDAK